MTTKHTRLAAVTAALFLGFGAMPPASTTLAAPRQSSARCTSRWPATRPPRRSSRSRWRTTTPSPGRALQGAARARARRPTRPAAWRTGCARSACSTTRSSGRCSLSPKVLADGQAAIDAARSDRAQDPARARLRRGAGDVLQGSRQAEPPHAGQGASRTRWRRSRPATRRTTRRPSSTRSSSR